MSLYSKFVWTTKHQRTLVVFFLSYLIYIHIYIYIYKIKSHAGFCWQHSNDPSMDEVMNRYTSYIFISYKRHRFFLFLMINNRIHGHLDLGGKRNFVAAAISPATLHGRITIVVWTAVADNFRWSLWAGRDLAWAHMNNIPSCMHIRAFT